MRMSIKSNAPELQKGLDALVNKQMPFAISLATNMSIQRSRDEHLRLEYRKFFEMRNKAWFNQVHSIRNSTAQHVRRTGVALAAIQRSSLPSPPGTRKKSVQRAAYSDFMEQHVNGGIKMAVGGANNVAIPITGNVTRRKGGAKAGAVNKSFKPKTVMGSGKGAVIESKGKKLLVRKVGRGGKRTQVLYTLKRAVQIKGGYNPERAVRRGMNQFFAPMMKRAMIRALKTAKLR
jgi:hypothetical protein